MKTRFLGTLLVCLILGSCTESNQVFREVPEKRSGVTFRNDLTESDDLNILDYLYFYNGGGVAIGDIDNDGLPDIFFSGNQVKNTLYRNTGNLQFEDITETAGVGGNSSWNTGAVMADVNGDGLLDIYVSAVVGIKGLSGYNELYINQGDGTFDEQAQQYGLDFESYSSSAAFFDYDLDGDLDMYLLNHAVHTSKSYGKASLRFERNYETGDKLLRNDNGKFVDVSESAGIFGGINGYGLGIAISDFNLDGYPDVYVGNDFHEDDYYYLNNGDGTFTESLKQYFGHTSRFSMGNDVADINHDGLPDLISLDMLPEDEVALKASEGDDNIQIQKVRVEDYGYHYQFTRNMLYINQPDGNYMETALLSGVAATDWSWSALFGDYDQDGHQDLFVANGIPKRPNDLDFIKFVSSEQIQGKINNTRLVDQDALGMMPEGITPNYLFQGDGNLGFENVSESWMSVKPSISGASAYGDLDNDGDLDLVMNNLNAPATILENTTNSKANYLKLRFNYTARNPYGLGTKAYLYYKGTMQFKELFPSRGFQASSQPMLHFGLGETQELDSIKIVWPDRSQQLVKDVAINTTLTIQVQGNRPPASVLPTRKKLPLFTRDSTNLGINFTHKEDNYLDFNREKLIPYKLSDRGPAFAIGDLNGDEKNDLFLGGSKYFPAQLYVQEKGQFVAASHPNISQDSIRENVVATIADFSGDGQNDLLVGNGGGDFFGSAKQLTESYYQNTGTTFQPMDFPELYQNSSVIKPFDFDGDGDLDVFLGAHTRTGNFGKQVVSQLLINEGGSFQRDPNFKVEGMVTDAIWHDFDEDGQVDLIVVGEWMSPKFLRNSNGNFVDSNPLELYGLWQSVHPYDIDQDGDTDFLLGNWGLNSKFKATKAYPLRLYYSDFDGNGQTETITAFEKNGAYYTLAGLDALAGQMVSLRKKFTNYSSFAGKSVAEILTEEQLNQATVLEVTHLASGYLKNLGDSYTFVPFKDELQVAPIMTFVTHDFDADGIPEALAGGNYFGVKPYHGRFDSFPGALIQNENEILLGNSLGLDLTQKSIRHLTVVALEGKEYLLVINNNDDLETYQINK